MRSKPCKDPVWLAGVDGCRAGWVTAFVQPDGDDVRVRNIQHFADALTAPEAPAIVAVDIPIGLPECIGPAGRGPERLIRLLLGERQSSVFSVPSRAAIYAADFGAACAAALATSKPPRKVSKQLVMIAPKIKEVDAVLRADRTTIERVCEVHPELAFWRLNGERALDQRKKVKGACYPGLTFRRGLLIKADIPTSVVEARCSGRVDLKACGGRRAAARDCVELCRRSLDDLAAQGTAAEIA